MNHIKCRESADLKCTTGKIYYTMGDKIPSNRNVDVHYKRGGFSRLKVGRNLIIYLSALLEAPLLTPAPGQGPCLAPIVSSCRGQQLSNGPRTFCPRPSLLTLQASNRPGFFHLKFFNNPHACKLMSMDLGVVPHPGPDTKNIFNHQPWCLVVKARFYIMGFVCNYT